MLTGKINTKINGRQMEARTVLARYLRQSELALSPDIWDEATS